MRRYLLNSLLVTIFILITAAACQTSSSDEELLENQQIPLSVSSPAFDDDGDIPVKYTCDGENLSPPLSWSGVPEDAKSLVLIADDPDAPIGTFVHWILFDLSPGTDSLSEGTASAGTEGENSFRQLGYGGPCPPQGSTHRYFFKLYALDQSINLESGAAKDEVEEAMQGHILAQGELMGKFGR
jgi:Raf kinase inhibitor-like YbhB/YbcL family protein